MFRKMFVGYLAVMFMGVLLLTSCEENLITGIGENDPSGSAKVDNDDLEGYAGKAGPIGKSKCFELVFPISLSDPEGELIGTASSEEELKTLVMEWKQTQEEPAKLAIVYPYEVILEDGTVTSVSNDQERIALREACKDMGFTGHCGPKPHKGFDCYELVFPVSFSFPNGTISEAGSKEEIKELLTEWKESNPGPGQRPELNFPITLLKDDGTELVANSREELKEARAACEEEQ